MPCGGDIGVDDDPARTGDADVEVECKAKYPAAEDSSDNSRGVIGVEDRRCTGRKRGDALGEPL